jgi:hypothetical protein
MAVSVRTEPAFEPAAPQPLFPTHVRGLVDNRNHYVVTRDGQQFKFTVPAGSTPSRSSATYSWIHVAESGDAFKFLDEVGGKARVAREVANRPGVVLEAIAPPRR